MPEYEKLKKIIHTNMSIEVLTGMSIGGNKETIEIGGLDNPVIKTVTRRSNGNSNDKNIVVPYIPGSSIKGRMRSLLELSKENDELINKVFGNRNTKNSSGYTRVLFEDTYPTNKTLENWKKISNKYGLPFGTEVKYENEIDRTTGRASNPRPTERVIPNSIFESKIRLLVFEGDDEEEMKRLIERGMKLMEMTYIGGNGSRGYGRIKINHDEWKEEWSNNG